MLLITMLLLNSLAMAAIANEKKIVAIMEIEQPELEFDVYYSMDGVSYILYEDSLDLGTIPAGEQSRVYFNIISSKELSLSTIVTGDAAIFEELYAEDFPLTIEEGDNKFSMRFDVREEAKEGNAELEIFLNY